MAGRFVRASKYRHVFGRPTKKEQCYDNLRVSRNAWDTNLVKANPQYLSVNWDASGGGAFAVIPLEERGKLPESIPLFRGHTAVVLDTDWSPFNDSLIASGSDDGKSFIWKVPDNFTLHVDGEVEDVAPVAKLTGHSRKIGHVLFNPAAENILATSSGDFTLKIWDVEAQKPHLTLKQGDVVQSLSWSGDGSMLVTTSRDKMLRIWDVRQEKPAHEGPGHPGAKNSRAVWMGELDRIATTGFSKMSDRQLGLWDIRAPREPMNGFMLLDSISGVCMPFYDSGNNILYLAGKGDGNIRYYEYENDSFEYLTEYKSADPQRGIAFMPKRGVNVQENEVTRAFKTVNDSYIEPISFIVPRRAEVFQADIYPPTAGSKAGATASEWLSGKTVPAPKIDLESVYNGEAPKQVPADFKPVVATPTTATPVTATPTEPKKTVASEPTPSTIKESTPAATVAAMRAPPPSMKEQGAAVSNMVSKYADDGEAESSDEEDETSSFEEVPKPVERPARAATGAAGAAGAAAAVTSRNSAPAEPSPVKSEAVAAATTAAATTPTTTASEPSKAAMGASLDRFAKIIRQQQIALEAQSKLVSDLAAEVQALKGQLSG